MTRLAIIDIDGIIANNTERFNKAEEAKQQYLEESRNNPVIVEGFSRQKEATNIFWQTAFNPELVPLDVPIDGAMDALATFAFNGWEVILLTSRPESMREATRKWLFEQGYPVEAPIIMKEEAFTKNYIKTVPWKAGIIQTFATYLNATEVVFIDDELTNRQEVEKYQTSYTVRCYASLAEAVEEI